MTTFTSPFSFRKLLRRAKDQLKKRLEKSLLNYKQEETKLNVYYSCNSEYVKCSWILSNTSENELKNRNIFCLALRIYDITPNSSESLKGTTIMKELEVNKSAKDYLLPLPINSGIVMLELGYRDSSKGWTNLASREIKLSLRNTSDNYIDDSWFYLSAESRVIPNSLHQRIYLLSQNIQLGGSENISKGGSEQIQAKNS